MSKPKILITTGGTGGHIYPAEALAQKLANGCEILFVGGGLSTNRYFSKDKHSYKEVSCGKTIREPFAILKGLQQSRQIIRQFKPDVVVGFGSYYTFPTLLAAKLHKIPIVLHEANRIPGRVNRLLSPYVTLTGVHFPDTAQLLKGKTQHIPIPLRKGYSKESLSRKEACEYFGVDPEKQTILIFGGSQGANAINRICGNAFSILPKHNAIQILHFTGDKITTATLKEQYEKAGLHACVKDFEARMDMAWQAANLMISRSGAGTVAEQLEFEVPGILIPFPQAMDNHQESNADFMVQEVQGAIKHIEKHLTTESLAFEIESLIKDDGTRIKMMRQNMQKYKNRVNSVELHTVIKQLSS